MRESSTDMSMFKTSKRGSFSNSQTQNLYDKTQVSYPSLTSSNQNFKHFDRKFNNTTLINQTASSTLPTSFSNAFAKQTNPNLRTHATTYRRNYSTNLTFNMDPAADAAYSTGQSYKQAEGASGYPRTGLSAKIQDVL